MPSNGDSTVTTQSESLEVKGSQDGTVVGQTNVLSPRLLDYKSASRYLSLSYWSVRTLVTSGEIPFIKFGKRILIDVQDLDDWISRSKETGV